MRRESPSLLGLVITATLMTGCGAGTTPAPAAVVPPPLRSARELVTAMHDRYEGKWYRTLTFVQRNTRYVASGADTSTWLEAVRIPGALRIDYAPVANRNGILFVRDSQFLMANGLVTSVTPSVHPLMVLAFDVYADLPERTLARLQSLGFDLSRLREDSWQGRPAYVVGAAAGDLESKQFWIDRERLVFVRMIQPGREPGRASEIRFDDYRPLAGGWIAPTVRFLTAGRETFLERYEDVQPNVALDDRLFDPRQWSAAPHWRAAR
jgi:hypothetical protein